MSIGGGNSILFVHSKDNRFSVPLMTAVRQHRVVGVHIVDIFHAQREGTLLKVFLNDRFAIWLPPDISYVPALYVPDEEPRAQPKVYYGEDICALLKIPSPFLSPIAGGREGSVAGFEDGPAASMSTYRSSRMSDEEVNERMRAREADLRASGGLYTQPSRGSIPSVSAADVAGAPSSGGPPAFLQPAPASAPSPVSFSLPAAGPPPPMGMPALLGAGLGAARAPLRGMSL